MDATLLDPMGWRTQPTFDAVAFFGVKYPHNDLDMEDWRSRDHFWDLLRFAHQFFLRYLPFPEMRRHDDLVSLANAFPFAKEGEVTPSTCRRAARRTSTWPGCGARSK